MQKLAAVLASAIPTNSPVNGPAADANLVVITGTDLTGATAVSFGGTAATSFVVNNATPITAIAPAHTAGTVDVAVTTPDGTSVNTAADNYTYAGAPTITDLTPPKDSTVGSNAVVITGTNLTAATAVSFGGTAATSFVVNSATQITAIAPAHAAGAVDVNVTTQEAQRRIALRMTTLTKPLHPQTSPSWRAIEKRRRSAISPAPRRRRPNGYRNQRLPPTLVMETRRPVNVREYRSAPSTLPGTRQALVIALRVKRRVTDRLAADLPSSGVRTLR